MTPEEARKADIEELDRSKRWLKDMQSTRLYPLELAILIGRNAQTEKSLMRRIPLLEKRLANGTSAEGREQEWNRWLNRKLAGAKRRRSSSKSKRAHKSI